MTRLDRCRFHIRYALPAFGVMARSSRVRQLLANQMAKAKLPERPRPRVHSWGHATASFPDGSENDITCYQVRLLRCHAGNRTRQSASNVPRWSCLPSAALSRPPSRRSPNVPG